LGYKPRTIIGLRFDSVPQVSSNLTERGLLARAFPPSRIDNIFSGELFGKNDKDEAEVLHKITVKFNRGNEVSPFHNAGIAYRGRYWTARIHPRKPSSMKALGDVLQSAREVPQEFYISQKKIPRWRKVKGAKRIEKKSRISGIKYLYAEGAIAFPDATTNPARTIVTSEGGKTASRMKHIIKRGKRYRRLTPVELERLNGFPDNHTAQIPETRRAFLMGNALIVGCVARIGTAIAETEGWHTRIVESNKVKKKKMRRSKNQRKP